MKREGKRMTVKELLVILKQVPEGIEPIVKSRVAPIIACSIPDGAVPKGWKATGECGPQQITGYRRIVFVGEG